MQRLCRIAVRASAPNIVLASSTRRLPISHRYRAKLRLNLHAYLGSWADIRRSLAPPGITFMAASIASGYLCYMAR